jgi:hypothetical protein
MLTPGIGQILVDNEGSATVPGTYKVNFLASTSFIGFSNENGIIQIGEMPSYSARITATVYDESQEYPAGLYQTGTGELDGTKYTPIAFHSQNASTAPYRQPANSWVESGKMYMLPANSKNWRLESFFKMKHSDFSNYRSKMGRIVLEVFETDGTSNRVVQFDLTDDNSRVSQAIPTFKVGSDVIFSDNSMEPYVSDNLLDMELINQNGAYMSKWSHFEGGIHMEKVGSRYSFTMTSHDNLKLDETHSISLEDGNWEAFAFAVHFGKIIGGESFELMSYDLTHLRYFGAQEPMDYDIFTLGDELIIDTSHHKRVLLNGTSFRDEIEQGSTFHKFPPGQSLVQILLPASYDAIDVELEIEEQGL